MIEERASHDSGLSDALAANLVTGWAPDVPLVPVPDDIAPYTAKRRGALAAEFPGETLVIPSGRPKVRANDTAYPFRASSDYVWLTGDVEPEGVLVMSPGGDAVLYVPDRVSRDDLAFFTDRGAGEQWVGRRPTPAETARRLGVECRARGTLQLAALNGARLLRGTGDELENLLSTDLPRDSALGTTLSELRLTKDEWEIGQLQLATEATARGFADAVRERAGALRYGERWIEGTFWRRARAEGNDVGYSSIVACGPHATILHWTRNDGAVADSDLLLLDMGVEVRSLYTADLTRTIPVAGRFTAEQRQVYELVHRAQQAGIAGALPGADFLAPNRAAMRVIAEGLHDWGILRVSPDAALSEDPRAPGAGLHRRYTLHNVSHMLGLDVHDCARARTERYLHGTLSPGMVLTVEPGIYFAPEDLTVPPELRGIGVRIEDDIAMTATGSTTLSAQLPSEVDALESWIVGLR
jgi:Xaa-Pro aminopeptidase